MNTSPPPLESLGLDPISLKWLQDLAALNPPAVYDMPLETARAGVEARQAAYKDLPRALCDDIAIPTPGGKTGVKLIRPPSVPGKLPVTLYIHGGGWVTGSPETHERLARELAMASGSALVMARYSRSPEARYPTALEETYAIASWLAENGGALGLDGSRLAVAGDSAGGTLATALTLLAKRRQGPAIRLQALLYPATDASCSKPSCREFENGPNLTLAAMRWYWDQYLPDGVDSAIDTISPLNASLDDLSGLPPALVISAEIDVLRDDGEAYARKLTQAGVTVTATRYLGALHGFAANNALAATPATRAAVTQIGAALKAALAKE
jgi:acetyl esterase